MHVVRRYAASDSQWEACVAHLLRTETDRWVVEPDSMQLLDDITVLGVEREHGIIATLTLQRRVIEVPATEWAAAIDLCLRDGEGRALEEQFVVTFVVEEPYRRQGIGRALQVAALDETRRSGCIQMRSWSSIEKEALFALKLSLGFAVHPATLRSFRDFDVSGVYFIKRVDDDPATTATLGDAAS